MKRAILVAVLAALGFLGLKALTGGVESTDYIVAVAAGIGAAVGFHIGNRRRERNERRG
jgi:hypothetical protein